MRALAFILLAVAVCLASALSAPLKVDQCAKCHREIDAKHAQVVAGYENDVHFRLGFTCASCHGGDAAKSDEEGMDPEKGFIGVPDRKDVPRVCGKCHSDANFMRHYNPALNIDQEEKYYTSRHGMLLKKGDRRVAICTSCHGVHGILPPENTQSPVYSLNLPGTCNRCHGDAAYMKPYGIRTDQYQEYAQSVHGVAFLEKKLKGAPVCNTCHGNHGAAPPGVNDVSAVCVSCHTFNGELYGRSPHKEAFREAGLSQCAACHDHHRVLRTSDSLLGVEDGALCIRCHSSGERGYDEARGMKHLLDSLIAAQTSAKAALAQAAKLDMDVTDGEAHIEQIRENVIAARTAVHSFTEEHMAEVTKEGFLAAAQAESLAAAAVFEYKFRRAGFGVATLIISGLALLLYLKIRKIERHQT